MLSWLQFTNVFDAMLRKREKNNSTQTVFGLEIESRLYQDAILLYIAQLRKTLYRHDIRHKSPQNYYRLTYILHSKRITMCKMVLLRKKKKKMEKKQFALKHALEWLEMKCTFVFFVTCSNWLHTNWYIVLQPTPTCRSRRKQY